MVNKKILSFILTFFIIAVSLVIKRSYALTNGYVSSNEYIINDNIIYAIPTSTDLNSLEFLDKVSFINTYTILNNSNNKIDKDDFVGTGYKFSNNGKTYSIVVLGDITGDGEISLGDIAALYNHYKGNKVVDGLKLEAGLLTGNDKVVIGDVAKLYNFYKGNKAFTYYNDDMELSEAGLRDKTLNRIEEIRNNSNTDISNRTGNIYYISNDGNNSNDGLSEDKPLKTIDKINTMMKNGLVPEGSTILFRDGDIFRGTKLIVRTNNILVGSYGDISKGKPILTMSFYDGAKEGEWIEVKPNIWKYTYNGSDLVFGKDVGTMWLFCNEGNNNCKTKMDSQDRMLDFTIKKTTPFDFDDTVNMDDKIDTILTKDLEFYHAGHSQTGRDSVDKGKQLYLYSIGNPKDRFDEIEFNVGNHIIRNEVGSLHIDNLNILFTGAHGISSSSVSNLIVTNCEVGFIGGSIQNNEVIYKGTSGENGFELPFYGERWGNGIEVYGSITDVKSETVKEGFIVDNCYVYQVYDAGITFQYTNNGIAHMERTMFTNNVVDYTNTNFEYWLSTTSSEQSVKDESYIKDFLVSNNISRYAGYGLSVTRPNYGWASHIVMFDHSDALSDVIKGDFTIRNNIFAYGREFQYVYRTELDTYPNMYDNTMYGYKDDYFGYNSNKYYYTKIALDDKVVNDNIPNNKVILFDKDNFKSDSGISGEVSWSYNSETNELSITGNGAMADYSEDNLPPWYNYRSEINSIYVGEGVTKLGKYAFYNLTHVIKVKIDAISLSNLSYSSSNVGNNFVMYRTGYNTGGLTLIFGKNVTKIPLYLTRPSEVDDTNKKNDDPIIKNVIFEGDSIKNVPSYGITGMKKTSYVFKEGITSTGTMSIAYNKTYFMILPDSLVNISDYAFNGNDFNEKLVFGPSISSLGANVLRRNSELVELVIPHINNTSVSANPLSANKSKEMTVYGDESTEEWVNNVKALTTQTNITYKPMSEYKCNIINGTSNSQVSYGESYTFSTNRNVKVYYYYDNRYGTRIYSDPLEVIKNGNTYTINNIKSDIYIEVE